MTVDSEASTNMVSADDVNTSTTSTLEASSTILIDTTDSSEDAQTPANVIEVKARDLKSDSDDADVDPENEIPKGYRTLVLGIHRVIYSPPPPVSWSFIPEFGLVDRAKNLARHGPSVFWLYQEIYRLDPMASLTIVTCDLMHAITPTIRTYLSNRILNLIETGYKSKQMDVRSIGVSLTIRMAVMLASSVIGHMQAKLESKLESRVQIHFRYLRLNAQMARLRGSIPEDDDDEDPSANRTDVWRVAGQLTGHVNTMISTFSESILMWKMLSGNNDSNYLAPMLLASWIVRALPALDSNLNRLWSQGYLTHVINKDYVRMQVVNSLARYTAYKESIIGLNLGPWIMQEFQTCMSRLQDTDLSDLYSLLWGMENPLRGTFGQVLDEWPTLYYIFSAMCNRSTVSFANISSVQTSSSSLRWKLATIFGSDDESVSELLSKIHKLFLAVQIESDPDGPAASYPAEETIASDGMAIEFQNVTFNYTGSKAKQPAIQDVSFSILPGQLVVIVGANGSGKTSMVKLLTRAYEPTAGLIKIDGHPAGNFKRHDLREATAFLSQDHVMFEGVSIAEDVGLGRWTAQQRREIIEQALHLGGADHLVSKLKAGSDTVLIPERTKDLAYQITSGPLKRIHDSLEKESSVSGGEKQRLVAARTFMRMNTGNVKLVVVDEPSAAMDPAGEFELFKHLREARQGKTMIFITHRFGHLTKYADVIFCMKDGELVERGTHAELVARKGEYFNLYNVQAQAFATDTKVENV